MDDLRTGIIFDIERCSMYDGPGIRTTVFLKGCPLSCKWCHNPESQRSLPELAFHSEQCICCGNCAQVCPSVHTVTKLRHKVERKLCKTCGKCLSVCPTGALKIVGRQIRIREIIEILKRDKSFFDSTGGGLTVSGGEPFSQYIFLRQLLKCAKEEDIHTCIETCGFTTQEKLDGVLPFTDLFLFDYKVTASEAHKEYTGVDNRMILDNFHYLYSAGKQIILRCPIIPGYNDTVEHFQAICDIEKQFPSLAGIEIMPYHSLGREKAAAVNRPYEITSPTVSDLTKQRWKKRFIALGAGKSLIDSF